MIKPLNAPALRMAGELKLTSNGDGAKTAKVTLLARSGDPVNIDGWGLVVHDFDGMKAKAKIPLDYNHDPEDSIGYLNNFDTSSGDLVCKGAIVLVNGPDDGDEDDDVAALVAKMTAGVPYEASIEFDDDMTLEYLPEGVTTSVNGRTVAGPVYIVRDWTLKAVAICKFGKDSNTSATVQLSESKTSAEKKGYFVRFANNKKGINTMNKNETEKTVDPVDAKASTEAVEAKAEAKAVEANVEAEQVQLSDSKAEASPVAAEVVEAKAEQPKQEEKKVEEAKAVEAPAVQLSESPKAEKADPRSEFKQFVTAFGAERAATYFAEGKSYEAALSEHLKYQASQIEELSKKLSAVERGAAKPITFSDSANRDETAKKSGLQSVIRLGGKA